MIHVVQDNILRNVEPRDNTIKEKMQNGINDVIISGHGFHPLGKVVDCDHNVLMPALRLRLQIMKSMPNLQKGLVVITKYKGFGGAKDLSHNIGITHTT